MIENKDNFSNKEDILNHLNNLDYSVIILTKDEAKKLEKEYKITGTSEDRLTCALGKEYKTLLSIKASDIKNLILLDKLKYNNYNKEIKTQITKTIINHVVKNSKNFPDSLCETKGKKNREEQIKKLINEVFREYEKENNNLLKINAL